MAGYVVELPSSSSTGDFGEDLFKRFVKKLMPDPVLRCSSVPVSKQQGVKTHDFSLSLACGCSPIAVEVKTMEPTKTEKDYAADKASVIDGMESVQKFRRRIADANGQLIGHSGPGILVVMTGPDDRACLPPGSGISAIDMAMRGNHLCKLRVPPDPGGSVQFARCSRDEEGARTKPNLNTAMSAVTLLSRQWHSEDLWELSWIGVRNEHAKLPICEHFRHELIDLGYG